MIRQTSHFVNLASRSVAARSGAANKQLALRAFADDSSSRTVSSPSTKDEIDPLEVFAAIDTNNDGVLQKEEFLRAVDMLNYDEVRDKSRRSMLPISCYDQRSAMLCIGCFATVALYSYSGPNPPTGFIHRYHWIPAQLIHCSFCFSLAEILLTDLYLLLALLCGTPRPSLPCFFLQLLKIKKSTARNELSYETEHKSEEAESFGETITRRVQVTAEVAVSKIFPAGKWAQLQVHVVYIFFYTESKIH